ncbi:MAG: glycerophosphodiester phosphodiesterase [Ruminococcus sp.]|nr:glycerophosphodiester phosphodiesterase [Ruminococcus sp.]
MDFGKYIAHRGLHNIDKGIPENTLAAFRAACDKGVAIELDVRLTKEGKVVVVHDMSLKKSCGIEADVKDFTYEQLSAFSVKKTDQKIPLFSQVLKLVDGRVPLLVEIKDGHGVGTLEKRTYKLLKKYKGEYAIQSFSPFSLLWFRIHAPEVVRGQLISRFKGKKKTKNILRRIASTAFVCKVISKPAFVACDLRSVTLELAFKIVDCNADFLTWTANTAELIAEAAKFSKSVIGENYPEDFDFDYYNENE